MADFVVGLTGGIGSGKTTVADQFAARGVALVDTDRIAREVVLPGEPALQRIADHFGAEVIQPDGSLDRGRLRSLVFSQPAERRWLEALLHPLIRQRTVAQLADCQSTYALLVSPLLLETDQHRLVQHVLVIDLPEALQLSRTQQRDRNSEAQVRAIIASQISRQQRLQRADSILDNSLPLATLAQRVEQLHHQFLRLAAASRAE